MTDGNYRVVLTQEAHRDLARLPQAVVRAAFDAILRLESEPSHPSLDCKPFARMGSVFVFRLNAQYRALFVGLSDRYLILCVDHRRNYQRLIGRANHWVGAALDGRGADERALEVTVESRRPTRFATRATTFASRLAGSGRPYLHDEWAAVLAGDPEMNAALEPGQQRALALGFVFAAIRLRVRDNARPLWRPVDWLLRVPSRTNAFIATAVGSQAILIVGDDGLPALVTEVWEPCGIAGASLFVLARWLRRVRGIEVAAEGGRADD
ncbi:type II toxin-antitoxin system RelE/ParE family toxin [Streptomyces sp. NPDC002962]|uniref:type II toxin-antitoxin system RelE family toxin n=1 Tax=Streptomyces sp. NPDC002962 TaxID=3364674 RepID=UPI00367A3C6E